MNHIYSNISIERKMKIHIISALETEINVADATFKIQMVVIVDHYLLCCVNLQSFLDNPSFFFLKHLWRINDSTRRTIFRVSFPLLVSIILEGKRFKGFFFGFLG